MKIETKSNGQQVLKEVYNSIRLETKEGNQISICMRDDTFEISAQSSHGWWVLHRINPQSGMIEKVS